MLQKENSFFFSASNFITTDFEMENMVDSELQVFISKRIVFNNNALKSKKIYVKKNALYLFKDKIKFAIDNWYLTTNSCLNLLGFVQKNFTLGIEFFDQGILDQFILVIEKWIIKKNFAKEHRILKMIGQGGFGKVFLSEKKNDQNLENYCLKEIEKKNVKNNKSYQYLLNEIKILRLIQHKNCLKLYEIYESSDSIYIVTEYLNGGTLREKLLKKKLKNKEAIKLTKNLLEAIQELNKYNMIHRDIKPENIMFKIKNKILIVKLIDFGLCADFTDYTNNSLLRDKSGTACYIAPEIIGMHIYKKFYNEKVDIFSIGIILYEILTGSRPFNGEDYKESLILNFQCNLDYSLIDDDNLRSLVVSLTYKNPQQRISISEALQLNIFEINMKKSIIFTFKQKKCKNEHQNSLRESLLIHNKKKVNVEDDKENSRHRNQLRMNFERNDKNSIFTIFKKKDKKIN